MFNNCSPGFRKGKTALKTIVWLFGLSFWLLACSGISSAEPGTQQPTPATTPTQASDPYYQARQDLLSEIKSMGVTDQVVLRAMEVVQRDQFVPQEYLAQAYQNHPLPIGYGQTISQPYIVAWMTELLDLQPGEKVLEIGTGSGYQAAILAEMDVEVYTIEIVPELAESAAKRLQDLGYMEVHTKQGDGYYGWEEYAPYDAIIVTAAPDHLPAPLVDQLNPSGRIVIPIGQPGWVQSLWKFAYEAGELKGYNLGGVQFVPFTGEGIEQDAGGATPTR